MKCDDFETVELKYFALDEMPELFCRQYEESKNDLQKLRNEAGINRNAC